MYGEDSEWCMRLRRLGHRIIFTPTPGTVFHTGSVSSDLVWNEQERLRNCYVDGIQAYTAVNNRALAVRYQAAELSGSLFRLLVYTVATLCGADRYRAEQTDLYRWRVTVYWRHARGR
jgi:GT2 family glycosyltransferase